MHRLVFGFVVTLIFALVSLRAQSAAQAVSGPPAASTSPAPSLSTPKAEGPEHSRADERHALRFDSFGGGNVIAAMAIGNEPGINAKLAVGLAAQLQRNHVVRNSYIVPVSFSLDELQRQCESASPSPFAGAYVVLPAAVSSANQNYLLITRSWSRISFATAVVECNVNGAGPAVTWVSNVEDGLGNRNSFSFLPLAALAAIYAIVAPSKTAATESDRSFPAPTPLPPGGVITTTKSTSSSTSNPSGSSSVAASLLTASTAQAAIVGSSASTEAQTSQAVLAAIAGLVGEIRTVCAAQRTARAPAQGRLPSDHAHFCSW